MNRVVLISVVSVLLLVAIIMAVRYYRKPKTVVYKKDSEGKTVLDSEGNPVIDEGATKEANSGMSTYRTTDACKCSSGGLLHQTRWGTRNPDGSCHCPVQADITKTGLIANPLSGGGSTALTGDIGLGNRTMLDLAVIDAVTYGNSEAVAGS